MFWNPTIETIDFLISFNLWFFLTYINYTLKSWKPINSEEIIDAPNDKSILLFVVLYDLFETLVKDCFQNSWNNLFDQFIEDICFA